MLKQWIGLGLCAIVLVGCGSSGSEETAAISQQVESSAPTVSTSPSPTVSVSPSPTARQQAALVNLEQLQQQSRLLSQQMSGRQQTINQLSAEANQLDQDLAQLKDRVKAYIQQNKAAAGCVEMVKTSVDTQSQFSQDVKALASFLSLTCGAIALSNSEFAGKVVQVNDQLSQAENRWNELTQRLQQVRSRLSEETATLEQEQKRSQEISTEIQSLQGQL